MKKFKLIKSSVNFFEKNIKKRINWINLKQKLEKINSILIKKRNKMSKFQKNIKKVLRKKSK